MTSAESAGRDLLIEPEGVRAFGNTSWDIAGRVAQAGSMDLSTNVSALTPALGLVGGDFVAAFAAAQTEHSRATAQLALYYATHGDDAHRAAAAYEASDAAGAAGVDVAGAALPAVTPGPVE